MHVLFTLHLFTFKAKMIFLPRLPFGLPDVNKYLTVCFYMYLYRLTVPGTSRSSWRNVQRTSTRSSPSGSRGWTSWPRSWSPVKRITGRRSRSKFHQHLTNSFCDRRKAVAKILEQVITRINLTNILEWAFFYQGYTRSFYVLTF